MTAPYLRIHSRIPSDPFAGLRGDSRSEDESFLIDDVSSDDEDRDSDNMNTNKFFVFSSFIPLVLVSLQIMTAMNKPSVRILFLMGILMSCEGFSSHPCQSRIHSMQSLKAQTEDVSLSEGLTTNDESRRSILSTMIGGLLSLTALPMASNAADTKALSEEYRQGTAALADMDDQAPVPREAYKKLLSGVIYADLRT